MKRYFYQSSAVNVIIKKYFKTNTKLSGAFIGSEQAYDRDNRMG